MNKGREDNQRLIATHFNLGTAFHPASSRTYSVSVQSGSTPRRPAVYRAEIPLLHISEQSISPSSIHYSYPPRRHRPSYEPFERVKRARSSLIIMKFFTQVLGRKTTVEYRLNHFKIAAIRILKVRYLI